MTDHTGGWIKLFRCVQKNPIWQERPFDRARAWVDLLLLANSKAGTIRRRGIKITVQRGEVAYSLRELGKRWGWSLGKVQRFLHELKTDTQIDTRNDTENVSVTALIHLVNYDKYQSRDTKNDTKNDTETGTKTGTEQEGKEVKEKTSSPESLRLSGILADLILQNNPENTRLNNGKLKDTVARWAKDIDKLIRLDGQDVQEIEQVIRWCQSDEFWKSNVLSGSKLREKWDQLILKAKSMDASGKTDDDRYAALRGV